MANLLEFDLRRARPTFCEQLGEKRFRATQLFRWIHQRGARDFAAMTDLAKSLRDKLAAAREVAALPVAQRAGRRPTARSSGCSTSAHGNAVETVFIPEADRGTLCVSSQAGCAVGCRFCSTGHQGFSRNLTTGEIVAQLWLAEFSCAGASAWRRRRARHHQRRDDGHGRAAAELRARWCRRCA